MPLSTREFVLRLMTAISIILTTISPLTTPSHARQLEQGEPTTSPNPTLTETITAPPTDEGQAPTETATTVITPTTTATLTPTVTATLTPTVTATPLPTATATLTPTLTVTPTVVVTPTPTATLTPTVTATPLPMATGTLAPTLTVTPTITVTPTATATPEPLTLSLSMQANPAFLAPGELMTVTLTLSNPTHIIANNVTLSATLPLEVNYETPLGTVTPGYNPLLRLLRWDIKQLNGQETLAVGFVARIAAEAQPNALNLTAAILSDQKEVLSQTQTSLIITQKIEPTPTPVATIAPPGPPARVQLGLKTDTPTQNDIKRPQPPTENDHWLAVTVTDDEGRAVADGTEVTLSIQGGSLAQSQLRLKDGVATTRLKTPPGQAVLITAQAGSVQAQLQLPDTKGKTPLLDHLHRPDKQYGPEVEAINRARNGVDANFVADNPSRQVEFRADGLSYQLKLQADPRQDKNTRRAAEQRLSLDFTLTGLSMGRTTIPVNSLQHQAEGNWVTYQAPNSPWQIVYEVGENTVEQYVVLEALLADSGDVVIEGRFQTSLQPVLLSDEEGIRFAKPGSNVEETEESLGYGPAIAQDERGQRITAHLELRGNQLSITIPGDWLAQAEYPVVIDPVIGPAALVSTLQGDARDPQVAYDGTNFLTVWDWNDDIYGQLIDANGEAVGDLITISQAEGRQEKADVVYNADSGEYLTLWIDRRYGTPYFALYAQRLNTSGSLVGDEIEVRLPSEYLGYFGGAKGAVSNDGDYLIVWSHQDTGSGYDMFGQMLTSSGVLSGSIINITGAVTDFQNRPGIAYDSDDETFLVTWSDRRSGSAFEIYGQQVDESGSLVGSNSQLASVSGKDLILGDVAANDNGQFLVTWHQKRTSSDYEVQAIRVISGSATGSIIDIDTGGSKDQDPDVTALSSSEYLVVWAENGINIDLRRVGSDGSLPGSVLSGIDNGKVPALVYGGSQVLAVWEDHRTAGQKLIVGQRISTTPTTQGDLIYISPYYTLRSHIDVAYQANNFLLTWDQVHNAPNEDVFVQPVDSQGQPSGSPLNITAVPTVTQRYPALAAGNGEYLLVWEDERNPGSSDIYGHLLNTSGQVSGSLVSLSTASGSQQRPAIAYNSSDDEYLVVWHSYENSGNDADVIGQLVSSGGSLITGNLTIASLSNFQGVVAVAYNPDQNRYLVIWEDRRPGSNGSDIYGQQVNADGSLNGSNFEISGASSYQYEPALTYNTSAGVYLAVWEDKRNGDWDIYGQVISGTDASLVGSNVEIAKPSGSSHQNYADVTSRSNSAEFVVLWDDRRNDSNRDIYLQRLDGSGNLLDESDTGADESATNPTINLPVAVDSDNYYEQPALIYNPDDSLYLLAWDSQGDSGVYVQRYTSSSLTTPTAAFQAAPTSGVVPVTTVFTDTSSGIIGYRTWDFGDGITQTTTSVITLTHTYLTTGTFTVALTVTNPSASDMVTEQITVTAQTTPSLSADFDTFTGGDEPYFWIDQHNDTSDRDDFEVLWNGQSYVFGTLYEGSVLVYSHYAIPGWSVWQDYEYSGTMELTDAAGEIGVSVYSRYPEDQQQAYLLRTDSGDFILDAVGTSLTGQTTLSVTLQANTVYHFKVQASTLVDRVSLKAKVWAEGQSEPSSWQAEVEDTSGNRITSGAIGLRTDEAGYKYFDDLVVTPLGEATPNLILTKTGPLTATAGMPVTYTLTVTNSGTATATNLLITDTIPAGASYLSGGENVGNVVSWTVTSLVASSSITRQFSVTATETITNDDYLVTADSGIAVVGQPAVVTLIGGRTWRLLTTTVSLPVVGEHALAYDSDRDVVVLYGGNATGHPYETTTWEFDGMDWTVATTTTHPNARYGAQMGYLADEGVVLFGGSDENDTALNETQVYTNATWSVASTGPLSRTYHSLAVKDGTAVYVFGGNDGTTYFNDLWRYDNGWLQVTPANNPPSARTLAAMTYDSDNNRLLLFGGRTVTGTILADLWEYDLATATWTELDPGGGGGDPPARMAHTLTYNPDTGNAVLVGGVAADGETLLGDTWHYDGGWTQASPETLIPARAYHRAVFTPDGIVVVSNGEVWRYE